MRNLFGWSVVVAMLVGGVAGAQQPRVGTQPNQPGTVRPGGQPGGVQPGTVPGRQPAGVQPGTVTGRQPAGAQPGQGQANQLSDQQIAAVIALGNHNEVQAARFAMDKLKSSEAKEIATMMIKDHSEAADKFARLAGPYGAHISTPGGQFREDQNRRDDQGRDNRDNDPNRDRKRDNDRSDASDAKRETGASGDDSAKAVTPAANAATAPNNPGTRVVAQATDPAGPRATNQNQAGQGAPNVAGQAAVQTRTALRPVSGGLDWVGIHQEIGEECLAGYKKELGRYEGNEFDKAFLGHATAAHMKAAAELRVFRRHVSPQLASEIDSALQTTEDHLKHIKEAMEEKKDEGNK